MTIKQQKKNFQTDGYCIAENILTKDWCDFITQYSLFHENQNYMPEGKHEQVYNAHSVYADPAMETMLLHLLPTIEKYTDLELFPTYSYYRVYRKGHALKIHKDRPSCEISATLCFGTSNPNNSWPIVMANTPVSQTPGDAVIYRGCDLEHYRDPFDSDDDDWHVQGFFHYVDKNGPYADWKYDKRSTIGEKNKNNSSKQHKEYVVYGPSYNN